MKKQNMLNKRVWCELPDSLLERMLPLLPVSSLLKFRCVCKSWNSYILSSDFLQLCADAASIHKDGRHCRPDDRSSYLLLSTWSHEYPLLAFDPSRKSWHLLTLDFLFKRDRDDQLLAMASFSLVAAAGGLLCLSDGESRLIVCNPVTQAKREIFCKVKDEEGEDSLSNLVTANMKYEEEERKFVVMVVGASEAEGNRQATWVYESTNQGWSRCKKQRETLFLESNGVFVGDEVYAMVSSFPAKLMVFNTATAKWGEHPASVPEKLRNPVLVQSSNSLMLLAALGSSSDDDDDEEAQLQGYRIWKLSGHVFDEVAHMPDPIFHQIIVSKEGSFDGFCCVAQNECIYLSSSEGCLVFDTCLNTWAWLPDSPILAGLHACIRDLYSMQPSLDHLN